MWHRVRSILSSKLESALTRAAKQKGKRRKKEKPERFKGVETIAEDWGKWKHGEKIDVTYPFKEGEEPQWIFDMLKKAHYGAVKKISDLDPYAQGYRFVVKRLRRQTIKDDNQVRAWREWSKVPSLKRPQKRPPPRIAP